MGKAAHPSHDTVLELHLKSSLFYSAHAPETACERILVFPGASCVQETPEGPRSLLLPAPSFEGRCADRSGPLDGLADQYVLEPGAWLFWQCESGDATPAEAIEFFAREAWWSGYACEGPYIVRFVEEDGHTAQQILRRREE